MIARREAEDAARLAALQKAAEVGITALERGAFREFGDSDALEQYLNEIADRAHM